MSIDPGWLITNEDCPVNTILVPTDFTNDTYFALQIACAIAKHESAELLILHVIPPEDCSEGDRDGDELNRDSALFRSCWNRFLQMKEQPSDVDVAFQVKIGRPVETIIDVAQNERCSMIVIAAHCRSYHYRHIHGSVSESLIRRNRCPVARFCQSPFRQEPPSLLEGLRRRIASRRNESNRELVVE